MSDTSLDDLMRLIQESRRSLSTSVDNEESRLDVAAADLLSPVRGNQRALTERAAHFGEQIRGDYTSGYYGESSRPRPRPVHQVSPAPASAPVPTPSPVPSPVGSPAASAADGAASSAASSADSSAAPRPAKTTAASVAAVAPAPSADLPPCAPALHLNPGEFACVIAPVSAAGDVVTHAERIALRSGPDTAVLLGGAKTLIPGQADRVRTPAEVVDRALANPREAYVLGLVSSPVASHARVTEKLIEAIDPSAVVAIIDARQDLAEAAAWLAALPAGLSVTHLALTHVWEASDPAAVRSLGYPTLLLDYAPATAEQWQLIVFN